MTPLPLNERATTRAVQGGIIKDAPHCGGAGTLLPADRRDSLDDRRAPCRKVDYPLGDCRQVGVSLDQPDADRLLREGRQYSERAARRILTDVAADWRRLFEVIR